MSIAAFEPEAVPICHACLGLIRLWEAQDQVAFVLFINRFSRQSFFLSLTFYMYASLTLLRDCHCEVFMRWPFASGPMECATLISLVSLLISCFPVHLLPFRLLVLTLSSFERLSRGQAFLSFPTSQPRRQSLSAS